MEGNLFVSLDEGKSWKRVEDIPKGDAVLVVEHPFNNRYVSEMSPCRADTHIIQGFRAYHRHETLSNRGPGKDLEAFRPSSSACICSTAPFVPLRSSKIRLHSLPRHELQQEGLGGDVPRRGVSDKHYRLLHINPGYCRLSTPRRPSVTTRRNSSQRRHDASSRTAAKNSRQTSPLI